MKRAARPALYVNTGIAENGGHSSDMFFVELAEKVDGIFTAKTTLSRVSAGSENEDGFEEAAAHCAPVNQNVRKQREIRFKRGGGINPGMRKVREYGGYERMKVRVGSIEKERVG